ncbi:MAG: LysM peptidoglycan-binding domain-containing protein [Hespellia sp.]|nr:LysM peptidoglycan-binding domain-containing protein [Hespellia sp.]
MSSNYQMYLKKTGTSFRFPVLPEKFNVSYGNNNDKLQVCGVGEVTIIQDSEAAVIQFDSFFPNHYFSGCNFKNIPDPKDAVETILEMMANKTSLRFTKTGGSGISMYVTIESFDHYEQGGDVGTVYYSMKLKEYREVKVRQITVDISTKKAKIGATAARTDTSPASQTYTVVKGDCLWNIAKKLLGSGAKYTAIYNANVSVIGGNPNLIYPGQVLTIPAA